MDFVLLLSTLFTILLNRHILAALHLSHFTNWRKYTVLCGGGHSTAPTNEAWIDWLTSKYNILDIDTVGSVLKSTSCRCFLGCYSVPITILFCSTTITCSGILYLHFKSDYQFYSWIILWACVINWIIAKFFNKYWQTHTPHLLSQACFVERRSLFTAFGKDAFSCFVYVTLEFSGVL